VSANLLDGATGAVMRSRLYPALPRAITTAVFGLIMFQLLLGPEAVHENFGSALTWILWWPLLPLALFVAGRAWCAVCPFGWLTDWVQKQVGLERPVPRFLKRYGIWLIDASFIAITWADHVFGIVSSPWGSGLLLLGMTTAVVLSGALWQRRAFCRYVCFLGGVQGNYSRAGLVQLRADTSICATCTARAACFNGTAEVPACPMFEFARTMDSMANCNLCANCIKSCPNDAISVGVRKPSSELWFVRKPKLPESFLAAAIMGIVLVQNVTMLDVWAGTLDRIASLTHTQSYSVNYTVAFAGAVTLPLVALAIASAISGRLGGESPVASFARFGYALIPLDLAAHLAHNLFHLLAEGKSILYTGVAFFGGAQSDGSTALVSTGTIRVLQFVLLAIGLAASLYTARRIAGGRTGASLASAVPVAVLVLAFGALNAVLFTMPMAMRM
jgi:polyferredoxin